MNHDKTYCATNDCPRRMTCERYTYGQLLMANAPTWAMISYSDFYQIEGDQCGFYVKDSHVSQVRKSAAVDK
jgi:hypothetical protein